MSDIKSSLAKAGHPLVELNGKDGSLGVLPFGARVLVLSSGGENVFWTNPDLGDAQKAAQLLTPTAWPNSGGDRTWIAPEAQLHISNLDDAWNTYQTPAAVDPGNYQVSGDSHQIDMKNVTRVHLHHENVDCDVEVGRNVRLAPNPLRGEPGAKSLIKATKYAGYELTARLAMASGADKVRLALWSAIQVPAGGEIIIPTNKRSAPRHYFGLREAPMLRATSQAVHFVIDAHVQHKIGVRAADVTGRVGYLRPLGDGRSSLVVRSFHVNPSGDYIDVPWDDSKDEGYAIQCYNDSGEGKTFGEMECHSPGIGRGTGRSKAKDISQLWAYVGESEAVQEIATWLLGPCL